VTSVRTGRAAVFAAPIRFGAGIQNKVLDVAMELPVVASPLAADGLPPSTVAPPIDGSTPSQFAAAILRRFRRRDIWTGRRPANLRGRGFD
jgi:hypothetical protein